MTLSVDDRQLRNLKNGDVVQLNETTRNPMFRFCFMTVTEVKSWGAVGFVQSPGVNGQPGGRAPFRASFEEMEYIGRAVLLPCDEIDKGASQ